MRGSISNVVLPGMRFLTCDVELGHPATNHGSHTKNTSGGKFLFVSLVYIRGRYHLTFLGFRRCYSVGRDGNS
jgi:hypothetical protein